MLRKNFAFTAVTVLTLVSGTAADSTVSGVVKPPPSTEPAVASPPFSIRQQGEVAWLVRPNGERFFSFGVCCVDRGIARADFRAENPGYAAWQHHADSNEWAAVTLKRLKSWGFTTVGGWSDFQTLKHCPDAEMAFALVLHIPGGTCGTRRSRTGWSKSRATRFWRCATTRV